MQVRANLKRIGIEVPSMPEHDHDLETAFQLRMICEQLYGLLEEAHKQGLGYMLPVAFRMLHESKMETTRPPTYMDLFSDLEGQELMDFEHANKLVFGDEPERDIDEPSDDEEEDDVPF